MKVLFSVLVILLLASCNSASSEKQKSASKDQTPKTKDKEVSPKEDSVEFNEAPKTYQYFAGSIGLYGEDVLMEICKEDQKITGRYWYLKHGRPIKLAGESAAKSDEWQIKESVKGVITGNMTLELNGEKLTGQWYAPGKKSEIQQVELTKVYQSEEGRIKPNFETYSLSKVISIYNGETDEEETATDDIRLVRIGDYVLFQYFVIGTNAHVGHINGLAKMRSDNQAIYKGEESCELTFTFEKNQVTIIEEKDCSYYRGMRAYFGGTLTKEK